MWSLSLKTLNTHNKVDVPSLSIFFGEIFEPSTVTVVHSRQFFKNFLSEKNYHLSCMLQTSEHEPVVRLLVRPQFSMRLLFCLKIIGQLRYLAGKRPTKDLSLRYLFAEFPFFVWTFVDYTLKFRNNQINEGCISWAKHKFVSADAPYVDFWKVNCNSVTDLSEFYSEKNLCCFVALDFKWNHLSI